MKNVIYYFLIFGAIGIGSAKAEYGSSVEAIRREILTSPTAIPFSVSAEMAKNLTNVPIGSRVPVDLGTEVHIAIYFGYDKKADRFLFGKTEEVYSPSELKTLKEKGLVYTDEQGRPLGGNGTQGEAGNSSGVGTGTGRGGSGFGAGELANAGRAGLGAGIAAGVIHGIVVPPGEKREMDRLQGELNAAAERTAAQQSELFKELAKYETQIAEHMDDFLRESASFERLDTSKYNSEQASKFAGSKAGQSVWRAREKMGSYAPPNELGQDLKDLSLTAADAAEGAYMAGAVLDAQALGETAELFSDVALGLNPFTSVFKDGLEAITGRHALTGRKLTNTERALAAVGFSAGLATMGVASSAIHGLSLTGRLIGKAGMVSEGFFQGARDFAKFGNSVGLHTAQGWSDMVSFTRKTLGSELGAVGDLKSLTGKLHPGAWAKSYDVARVQEANLINAQMIKAGFSPAYKQGSIVYDVLAKENSTFLRMYHPDLNKTGRWLVRGEAIDKSLSAEQLSVKYSLPFTPKEITEVFVKKGTLLRRGKVGAIFGGSENAIQYEVLDAVSGGGISFGRSWRLP